MVWFCRKYAPAFDSRPAKTEYGTFRFEFGMMLGK
jgi:hypothetical protein